MTTPDPGRRATWSILIQQIMADGSIGTNFKATANLGAYIDLDHCDSPDPDGEDAEWLTLVRLAARQPSEGGTTP